MYVLKKCRILVLISINSTYLFVIVHIKIMKYKQHNSINDYQKSHPQAHQSWPLIIMNLLIIEKHTKKHTQKHTKLITVKETRNRRKKTRRERAVEGHG